MRYIRAFLFSIGFLLFFFSFTPDSFAAEGKTYEVSIPTLNARSAPSHHSDIVSSLHAGDKIVSFQEKHGWLMTYNGGEEVWVASQFLVPIESGKPVSENEVQKPAADIQPEQNGITVQESGTRIRAGSGTDYDVIGSAQSGKTYPLLDTSGDWHQIKLENGSSGWIASWLTDTPVRPQTAEPQREKGNSPDDIQIRAKETAPRAGSLAGATIVLDPGHGGKDPGSIGFDGIFEKDMIASITGKIAGQLRSAGANVILTRSGDDFISLDERVNISHTHQADAFISLHYNAFPVMSVQGVNTYYDGDSVSGALAKNVHTSLMQHISLMDRGVRQANFKVLRENRNPAVLLELGFITNPDDLLIIQSAAYQNGVAVGITEGLKHYFQ